MKLDAGVREVLDAVRQLCGAATWILRCGGALANFNVTCCDLNFCGESPDGLKDLRDDLDLGFQLLNEFMFLLWHLQGMLVSLTELVVCILAFQVWINRSWIPTIK